jgi:hypothetical protein
VLLSARDARFAKSRVTHTPPPWYVRRTSELLVEQILIWRRKNCALGIMLEGVRTQVDLPLADWQLHMLNVKCFPKC